MRDKKKRTATKYQRKHVGDPKRREEAPKKHAKWVPILKTGSGVRFGYHEGSEQK